MPFSFPTTRLRRLRQFDWTRRLVAENDLSVDDLIWPVFVQSGRDRETPVESMPGVHRFSIDRLVQKAAEAAELGIPAIAIFPETDASLKSDDGSEATNPDNLVCQAVRAVKHSVPQIGIICDVALDPYTSHGHDGVLVDGVVANDESVEILAQQVDGEGGE